MAEPSAIAKELARRRISAGLVYTANDALAEVLLLKRYGIVPTIDSLSPSLHLVVQDGKARDVQLMPSKRGLKVPVDMLEGDVVVFVEIRDKSLVGGWTVRSQVLEAPVEGDCYILGVENLWPYPQQFVFDSPCDDDPCCRPGVYDDEGGGWECFWCPIVRLENSAHWSVRETTKIKEEDFRSAVVR